VDLRAPWQAFDEIPSVAFVGKGRSVLLNGRTAQQVIVTPRGAAVEMNDLPPLDYSLIDPRAYYTERDQKIPYISSYGCPFACTYCSEPATSGRTWTGLDPRRIVNEGATLWDRYAPQAIDFMDPNFSSRPARVVAFVEEAVKRGNGAQYMCNMRARDVAVLSKMIDPTELRRAGFTRIFIGVESGSDRMLDALKKGARVSDTITATQALARADIEVHVSFMHDLPEEDEEDSIATMELAKLLATLPRNRQSHHFFTPYPGTELFERYFSDHMDISISQDTWASSSTYRANGVWSGRPAFRERVLERLEAIKDEFPTAFEGTRLPHLEMTEAV